MLTRSPFPGMDPWLESHWGNVHLRLISEIQRQIAPQLPNDLFVLVEEMVYLIDAESDERSFRPDVAMFHEPKHSGMPPSNSAVLEAEPIRITCVDEPVTERFLEIRSIDQTYSPVTAIRILSPTTKSKIEGRTAYLYKRRAYQETGVNLVEIDLLRGGHPMMGTALESWIRTDPRLAAPYRCIVYKRKKGTPVIDVYPLPLRQRLQHVRIPLRPGQPEISIDLQQPIDIAYQLGSYGRWIDYSKPPHPPLAVGDAEWANEMVKRWA